jgi:hypothetical protein
MATDIAFEPFVHASKLNPPSHYPGWIGVLRIGELRVSVPIAEDDLSHGLFRIPPEYKESGRKLVPDAEKIVERLTGRVQQMIMAYLDWESKNPKS